MKALIEQLTRQLLILNRISQSEEPVPTDTLLRDIERYCLTREFAFPSDRNSRMRMIQRDIRSIDEMFYVSIKNKRGQGYYVEQRDEGSPIDTERFIADFDLLSSLSPETNLHKYVIPERNRYIGSDNFYPLLKSIKETRIVEFDYYNVRKKTTLHHRVLPVFLKQDQMRWYLVGIKESEGTIMLFAIDRINNLEITEEKFKRTNDIDIESYFKNSYGIWNDPRQEAETVVLKYDQLDGTFLKSAPLHPSQKILVDTETEFIISLEIKITNDFKMALLSRSRSLEVLEPAHLRDEFRTIYAQA
ncbi:MAG: WYL domain-containing protein, partial [Muribaculaceae bacterium]|nr:WYL domain-containing protein [Muribaculaceae bacterium]